MSTQPESGSLSLWTATTPDTQYSSLKGENNFDVAVVGAGIAGITTAYMLTQAGKRVALIESKHIAGGVTANTTAKITSGHQIVYSSLKKTFGIEGAKTYGEANQWGLEWIASEVEAQGLDCDFTRHDMHICALREEDVDTLKDEFSAAQEAGLPVSYETSCTLPFEVQAVINYKNQAQFHPRKYLLGLAEKAVEQGLSIFENSRVQEVKEGEKVEVCTKEGKVIADYAVITTHFPIHDPAFFFARLAPYHDYALAARIEGELPPDMYIEISPDSYAVRTQDDLLVISGVLHKVGQGRDTSKCYEKLEQWTREHFKVQSIEYRWSTQDPSTLDKVPYIGTMTPAKKNILVATGFGGWGMAAGTYAGRMLADACLGIDNQWAEFFSPNRINLDSLKTLAKENANVAKEEVVSRLQKDSLEDIQSGEGRAIEENGEKIGVYKDENGTLHKVSRTCTHMGCTLNWNPAEHSWDCPCHGSRFTYEGVVMQGPAVEDLDRK